MTGFRFPHELPIYGLSYHTATNYFAHSSLSKVNLTINMHPVLRSDIRDNLTTCLMYV